MEPSVKETTCIICEETFTHPVKRGDNRNYALPLNVGVRIGKPHASQWSESCGNRSALVVIPSSSRKAGGASSGVMRVEPR